jgi:hypothetical protein
MATAPPKDLSRLLTPNRVLAAAGISVKGVLPEVTTCPGCKHEGLAIYMDPTSVDSNRWMYCHHCGFRGDSLELYNLVRRAKDLHEAVVQAGLDDTFNLSSSEFTPEAVLSYVEYFPTQRKKIDTMWKHFRANLGVKLGPDLSRRMQNMHLWSTWNYGQGLIGKFMGGGGLKEINKTIGEEVLPKEGFKTSLIFNYQDVPGRTIGFQFIGEKDRRFKFFHYNHTPRTEGGLAMLDLLDTFEDTVFAVSDPIVAMHIQRRHLVDFNTPLKIVVFNDSTWSAWESVSARQVVLWAPRIDWRLFHQARLVKNGCITIHPQFHNLDNDTIYSYVIGRPTNVTLQLMAKHARPWYDFFIDWATSDKQPEFEVRDAVKQLSFNPRERELLMDNCPRANRVRLENFLTDIQHDCRSVVVNRNKVFDRPDGWFTLSGLKSEELLLDTPVKLFREIVDTATATTYWHGALRHKFKMIEFVEEVNVIEKNPNAWLRDVLAREGLGIPTFNQVWAKYFIYLVKCFNDPKHVKLSTRMGIQPDGDILMPLFKVHEGQISEEETYLDPKKTPGIGVKQPVKRAARQEDVVFPARTAVIAGFAATIYNWLLALRDEPACPVIFVGPLGSIGNAAARHICKVMSLTKQEVRYHWRDSLYVLDNLKYAGLPTFIEPQTYGLIRNFPNPFHKFCLLQAERSESTALACGGPWLRIYAPNLRSDSNNLPPVDDMFNYLIDLQSRQYNLPAGDLMDALLEDMAAWYQKYLGGQEGLLAALKTMVLSPLLPGDGLIELVCWLHQSGRIDVHRAELSTQVVGGTVTECARRGQTNVRTAIVYGTAEKAVYVSRSVLGTVLARDKLSQPDFARITDDLANRRLLVDGYNTPDGWVIQRSHWDACVSNWKRL